MNKKRIRLTESQLHRVIKESVKKMVKEPLGLASYTGEKEWNYEDNIGGPDVWKKYPKLYKEWHEIVRNLRRLDFQLTTLRDKAVGTIERDNNQSEEVKEWYHAISRTAAELGILRHQLGTPGFDIEVPEGKYNFLERMRERSKESSNDTYNSNPQWYDHYVDEM